MARMGRAWWASPVGRLGYLSLQRYIPPPPPQSSPPHPTSLLRLRSLAFIAPMSHSTTPHNYTHPFNKIKLNGPDGAQRACWTVMAIRGLGYGGFGGEGVWSMRTIVVSGSDYGVSMRRRRDPGARAVPVRNPADRGLESKRPRRDLMPSIRAWTRRNYAFSGSVTPA